jgi:hypothetical protein
MSKYIVRYLLEADGTVPKFIENGGHLPLGEELVGLTIDASKRHVPSTVKRLTKLELEQRVLDSGYSSDYTQIWLDAIGYSYEQEQ